MDSLYAISIRGTTVYAYGKLSDDECAAVHSFAQRFQVESDGLDIEFIAQLFLEDANEKLQLSLAKISVKYVFRIE
ncbi:MAG: hypothetical protein RR444_01610 [Oscillospiraceae bacterium]